MSCNTLTNYTVPCKQSSGVSVVYVAPFSAKGTPTLSATSGTITAWSSAANAFYTFETRAEVVAGSFNGTGNDANGTFFYTHQVAFNKEQLSGVEGVENDILAKGNWLIIVKEQGSGKYFLYGYTNGMRCSAMENTHGVALGDFNGTKFTFTSNEPAQAYEVDSSIIAGLLA